MYAYVVLFKLNKYVNKIKFINNQNNNKYIIFEWMHQNFAERKIHKLLLLSHQLYFQFQYFLFFFFLIIILYDIAMLEKSQIKNNDSVNEILM